MRVNIDSVKKGSKVFAFLPASGVVECTVLAVFRKTQKLKVSFLRIYPNRSAPTIVVQTHPVSVFSTEKQFLEEHFNDKKYPY
jgi:hypothetical protein